MIDTHCHLDMLGDSSEVLARASAAGVDGCITIGVDLESSRYAARAAAADARVWATVGLHPHEAKDRTDELMRELRALVDSDRVVGIGETGLDYHYDNSPREQQRAVFAEQIRMARDTGKTLVIHSREAWDDTFAILDDEGSPDRVVFHCFSGGPDEAERALARGAVLSFSGVVTFRNAQALREAVRVTPLDRIVIETDAPFLTPVPHRGKPNEPAFVAFVADEIARVKDRPVEEIARATHAVSAGIFLLK